MLKKCVQGNIFSRGITVCCWVDSFGAIPVISMIILLIWQHFQRKTQNSQTDVWIANVWSIINTKWSNLSNEFIIPHFRSFFVAVVQHFLPPPMFVKFSPPPHPFLQKKENLPPSISCYFETKIVPSACIHRVVSCTVRQAQCMQWPRNSRHAGPWERLVTHAAEETTNKQRPSWWPARK